MQGKATLSDPKMISFLEGDPPGHYKGSGPRLAGRGLLEERSCLQWYQGSYLTEEDKGKHTYIFYILLYLLYLFIIYI